MENLENEYQITKTIRFKLIPQHEIYNPYKSKEKETKNVSSLISKIENILNLLKNLLYAKDKNGEFILKKDNSNKWRCDIKIKYTWMRNFMKTAFYANKEENPPKHYKLADLEYVQNEFDKCWFIEMQEIIDKLKDFQKSMENNEKEMQRDSQAALIISQLAKRNNFEFIKGFVLALCATNKPETDKLIDNLKKAISELEKELNIQKENFLPSQSKGVQFAAGSFNFYTVNKSPKMLGDYLIKEKAKLKRNFFIEEEHQGKKYWKPRDEYKEYDGIIEYLGLKNELQSKSLEEVYREIKKWKAKEKKKFMEALQANDDAKFKSIKLFESSDKYYNEIKNRILSIQELANKLNNPALSAEQKIKYKNELKELKQKKNDFFNTFIKPPQTPKYKKLCDFYRRVAQERGNIISKIAAIEKDKNFAEQLRYWCVIIEKEKRKFLYMIPFDEKDNMKKANDYISKLENITDGKSKLHYFNSLTLRALKKLCFKESDNTFKEQFKKVNEKDKTKYEVEFPRYEQEWKDDEQRQIDFYQNILRKQKTLDLSAYENVSALCENQFESIEDFESEINKICYAKTVLVSDETEEKLKKDFNAICFEITSQDIEHSLKYPADGYRNKKHTEIWMSFWKDENERDKFPLRLNPEIKIMWRRPKASRIIKYGENSNLYDQNMKNRYLHEQFTLATTITDNAHNIKTNLAFQDVQYKGEAVIEFNKNYTVDKFKYAMGIDVGTTDLACLSITDKNKKPQSFDVYEIRQDKLDFLKTGFLKDGQKREKPYRLIQNPSYFLNKDLYKRTFKEKKEDFNKTFDELFEKKKVSAIDLTTAKVIAGKIILNGDFSVHQNLKILNAKRKISQALKDDPAVKIYEKDYKWYIENQKNAIYHSKILYNSYKPYDEVKKELSEFIKDQKSDDARLEDNINKTRASLVANMIGVIDFLYEQFPGFIVLENLSQSIIESHREKFEGDITRPLEWAIYRKFQSKCLVPPISELLKLREKERLNSNETEEESIHQFGIVKFINERETSLLCPKCGKKAYNNSDDPKFKEDKNNTIFQCKECGFHNKNSAREFSSLDTNDKIAAFNIAKRCFEANK